MGFWFCWIIFFKGCRYFRQFKLSWEFILIHGIVCNFVKVSEQLCTLDFKTFDNMFLNVVAFLIMRSFFSFSMSELFMLFKENDSGQLGLLPINNMLGWCLCLLIAFIMGSVMSLCSSLIYGFSFICKLLVAFLKKLFSSWNTKCSSGMIFSFSSTRAILFLIFQFSRLLIFPKTFVIIDFFWICFIQTCFASLFM